MSGICSSLNGKNDKNSNLVEREDKLSEQEKSAEFRLGNSS